MGSNSTIDMVKGSQTMGSQDEDPMDKKARLRGRMIELVNETTLHGLPRIYTSVPLVKKTVWLLFFLLGFGTMTWQIDGIVHKYWSFPVKTTLSEQYNGRLPFPAVTFCNINPIRRSAIPELTSAQVIKDLLKRTNLSLPQLDPLSISDMEDEASENHDGIKALDEALMPIHLLSSLSRVERISVGHRLEDMLMSCTFEGKDCYEGNFTVFSDVNYGNCFTFNTFKDTQTSASIDWSRLRHVRDVGPNYALTLTLYVEQSEYISVTDDAGVRVVVHNQTEAPFPQDNGFNVPTGQSTYVGLKRADYIRMPPPYGKCGTYYGEKLDSVNMYKDVLPYLTYSQRACRTTCYQKRVISQCGCGDPYVPLRSSAFNNLHPGNAPLSPCITDMEVNCNNRVFGDFGLGKLGCSKLCPQSCRQAIHTVQVSTATWPSQVKEKPLVISIMREEDGNLMDGFRNLSNIEERRYFIRNNVLKLKIFFRDLSLGTQDTSPSYQVFDMLGDIGGLTGLYLGMSMLTLLEFIELVVDVCIIICRRGPGVGNQSDVKTLKS